MLQKCNNVCQLISSPLNIQGGDEKFSTQPTSQNLTKDQNLFVF